MSGSITSRRAHTLESEFFNRVDQELILKIQECHQLEVDEDALCIATGIVNRKLLDELLAADITPKTLLAFSLFPAVYVAWVNAKVEAAEGEAILEAAHCLSVKQNSPAHQLLEKWLTERPTDDLTVAWKDFIHAIRPTLSDAAFCELRDAAIKRARDIAEAAGGILNILNVSEPEKRAIAELESVFDDAMNAAEPASNP